MGTGSFINNVYGRMRGGPEPQEGMGATILMYTDRHAATIVRVGRGRRPWLQVQRDHARRVDDNGMSDAQQYEYQANPEAPRETYTLRKNGAWVREHEAMDSGTRLLVGKREEYYDFSF